MEGVGAGIVWTKAMGGRENVWFEEQEGGHCDLTTENKVLSAVW